MTSPVLHAVTQAALDATGAARGWVVAVGDSALEVVSAIGPDASELVGRSLPEDGGTAGFVIASGQPLALTPGPDDARLRAGVAALVATPPSSIVCVPCATASGVHGALEIADKRGGSGFSFDDLEVVTLLAGIAGAAMGEERVGDRDIPTAAALSAELHRLEASDPDRYARVAVVCDALLGSG